MDDGDDDDDDDDDDEAEGDDEDDDDDDDDENAASVYAISTYPRIDLSHRVEHPYNPANGPGSYDDGTM